MGGGGGGALFLNFVYAHSGADCILMVVASKFSVHAEHHPRQHVYIGPI